MFQFFKNKEETDFREDIPYISLSIIGAVAGFISGMLGTGGGGIVAPLLRMKGFSPKFVKKFLAVILLIMAFKMGFKL